MGVYKQVRGSIKNKSCFVYYRKADLLDLYQQQRDLKDYGYYRGEIMKRALHLHRQRQWKLQMYIINDDTR